MRKLYSLTAGLLLLVLAGCSTNDKEADAGPGADQQVADSQPAGPDIRPAGIYRVAAVQYTSERYADVDPSCTDDVCGLTKLMEQAAAQGAQLVVTPEYATDQTEWEAVPGVGDNPATDDTRWPEGSFLKAYAKVADRLDITAVVNLITEDSAGKLYNTDIALDQDGKVVARHYKLQLYGEKGLTPGHDVTASFFDTPLGKAGLLICADAHCFVTGVADGSLCTSSALGAITAFIAQKPKLVVFNAFWTVGPTNAGGPSWWPLNVQKLIAKTTKAYVVGANIVDGPGIGGGIFDPAGTEIDSKTSNTPVIVYGDLPLGN